MCRETDMESSVTQEVHYNSAYVLHLYKTAIYSVQCYGILFLCQYCDGSLVCIPFCNFVFMLSVYQLIDKDRTTLVPAKHFSVSYFIIIEPQPTTSKQSTL